MHVYNLKISKNKVFKGVLLLCILVCIIIFFYSGYYFYSEIKNSNKNENFVVEDSYFENGNSVSIPSSQYTNVLKEVHDNLDDYIGKEISFVGYVYKIDYLEDNQFVLARNMIINSASQSVIVGFLSEYENINEFDNLTWVYVTGTIEKGNLNGEIPLLKVKKIEKADKPEDEFVYPPDNTYVPTSSSLY